MRGLASLLDLYDLAIVLFSRVSISANVSNLLSCLITVLLVNFHFSIIQVSFGSIVTSLSLASGNETTSKMITSSICVLIPRQLLILHGSFMDTQCSTVHFHVVGFVNFAA